MLADQRNELIRRDEKRNRVNESEQSENDEPRQPIAVRRTEQLPQILRLHQSHRLRPPRKFQCLKLGH